METNKHWIQSENDVKLVTKPWGSRSLNDTQGLGEMWLNYAHSELVGEQEKRYVFKKLYIKAGTKTSLQYHVHKDETNHLISGDALALMENERGEMEESPFTVGDSWTIPCGRKHRLIALTDLIMLEASSPEVDDVVRIQDDAGRGSGRIESEHTARVTQP